MTQDLTKGKPFPTILTFSLPVIGGNLFQLFYTLADSVIVGQALGPDALAAVGSTGIILYLVLCFIQGVTGGFGICLGYQCGQRNEAGMRESIAASLWLCLLCTVCITVPCCMLARRILVWMNTPEQIFSMAYDYMFVVLLGARIGYPGICLATPLAWCGASLLLVPVYFQTMRRMQREGLLHRA